MHRLLRTMVLPALLLAAVLAGCGGEDRSAGTRTATATATAPAAAASPTTATTPQRRPPAETERIGACLKTDGYRLQGGPSQPDDPDAPEYQILLSGSRGGAYIGFYKNAARAARVAKQFRKNARRTTGTAVERHGAINVVWVDLPDPAARASVRACLTV